MPLPSPRAAPADPAALFGDPDAGAPMPRLPMPGCGLFGRKGDGDPGAALLAAAWRDRAIRRTRPA